MTKLKKRILIGTGIVLLLIIMAAAGMSYYFGKLVVEGLFYQNEGNDTRANSIAQLELWGYDREAFEAAYQGENFEVKASDGNTVPGTYYTTDGNREKDTVVMIHGAGGDRIFNYPQAEIYLENGWNVVTFDQRGHGDNESGLVTFGYLEKMDVEALVDYTKEQAGDHQIVVHGISMGGATAGLYAATEHGKENINAVIMDSPVHSMEYMFLEVWHQMEDSAGIPDAYMIACGNLYMKLHYRFTFDDVEIGEEQQYNEVKTMVIVSGQDDLCLPEFVTQLYENVAAENKTLKEFDSAHVEGVIDYPQAYEEAVMEFLAK